MSDSASDSEMILVPIAMYPDPFRGGDNKLVLCETYETKNDKLIPTGTHPWSSSANAANGFAFCRQQP